MSTENKEKVVVESLEDAVSVVMESTWPHYLLTPEKMEDIWNNMDYPKVKTAAEEYGKQYYDALKKNQPDDFLRGLVNKFCNFMQNMGFDIRFARWVAEYLEEKERDLYFEPDDRPY